jgi:hypothetical protein
MQNQNPQQIRVGETVFVRQQGFGGWKEEVVEAIEVVNGMLCAKFNKGWSHIGLDGDGIRRERPNVMSTTKREVNRILD